jgi:hypothetical protein
MIVTRGEAMNARRWSIALAMVMLVTACARNGPPPKPASRMTGGHVVLHMNDGRVLSGVVQTDDHELIYVETSKGRSVAAPKSAITRLELHTQPPPDDHSDRKAGLILDLVFGLLGMVVNIVFICAAATH